MPDIELRLGKDMLTIASPLDTMLYQRGFEREENLALLTLTEPETIDDILRLQKISGAQCLVAHTAHTTTAELAYDKLRQHQSELLVGALRQLNAVGPQHALVEINPCGLPLDPESRQSLKENKGQYAAIARALEQETFDAFFLNGFKDVTDLKCALMGLRQISGATIIVSVKVDSKGNLPERGSLEEALAITVEYQGDVFGFESSESLETVEQLLKACVHQAKIPLLVSLESKGVPARILNPPKDNPYYSPDMMIEAALRLRAAGAHFLRATGAAVPSFTAVLAATMEGLAPLNS